MSELHTFPPIWNEKSRVLILGSFPSVRSREEGFYYGHPRNRFWQVLAAVYGAELPATTSEKTDFLLEHRIALWDVAAECEVQGSADSSIRNVRPNDIPALLAGNGLRRVFVNGRTAESLYRRLILPSGAPEATLLPSTSPANAAWSLDRLIDAWKVIRF